MVPPRPFPVFLGPTRPAPGPACRPTETEGTAQAETADPAVTPAVPAGDDPDGGLGRYYWARVGPPPGVVPVTAVLGSEVGLGSSRRVPATTPLHPGPGDGARLAMVGEGPRVRPAPGAGGTRDKGWMESTQSVSLPSLVGLTRRWGRRW